VPMVFPPSLSAPPSPSPPAVRESCGTSSSHLHTTSASQYSPPITPPFGDPVPVPKPPSSLHVGFCNVGGFLVHATNNSKVLKIKLFIASFDIDIFGGCESNLNWYHLLESMQLKEWFCTADSCHTLATHNTHKLFGKHQFGGTFWVATSYASCHISSSDKDPSKLGSWVVCTLLGHLGKKLHIIFGYCPCTNSLTHLKRIISQHCCYFSRIKHLICPHQVFLDDLAAFMAPCHTNGNAILLLGDMNGDICHHCLQNFFFTLGLCELILSRFPDLPAPAMFWRGSHSGTVLIYGVWVSGNIMGNTISWCSPEASPGDHHAIVLDINLPD